MDNEIDYWKILKDVDSSKLKKNFVEVVIDSDNKKNCDEWIGDNCETLLPCYLKGIEDMMPAAVMMSLNDFSIMSYVAIKYNGGVPNESFSNEVKNNTYRKPLTTDDQKELNDMYSDDNVSKNIDDLLANI